MEEKFIFGPWKQDYPKNKWNEYKLGKLSSWYSISASSLQTKNSENFKNDNLLKDQVIENDNEINKIQKNSFLKKKNQFLGNWEDPHNFELFLSSNQYILHGWPNKHIPLEDSIYLIKQQNKSKIAINKKNSSSKIPKK